MEDGQRVPPAAWCRWCGRELYPGETAYTLWGETLHRECVEGFALDRCRRRTLGGRKEVYL